MLCRGFELVGNDLGVLLAVPLFNGCLVLVPVGKGGRVLIEHLHKTAIEKPIDVAYVGAIFKRRPDVRFWSRVNSRTRAQDLNPLLSCDECSLRELFGLDVRGRKPTLVAPPAEYPGPILGVRLRLHWLRGVGRGLHDKKPSAISSVNCCSTQAAAMST